MAKLSKDDLQRIVEQQMPKYKLAEAPTAPAGAADGAKTRAEPEAQTPDLQTLRKKYLREKFLSNAAGGGYQDGEPNGQPAADAAGDDTEIVLVEPKEAPHPLDRGSRPKAIVVSTSQKKIIGKQG
jgi:hypothetical protein